MSTGKDDSQGSSAAAASTSKTAVLKTIQKGQEAMKKTIRHESTRVEARDAISGAGCHSSEGSASGT